MHYARVLRTGSAGVAWKLKALTPSEALAVNTAWDQGCLIWTGHRNDSGYGLLTAGGRQVRAHRWVFESTYGPIPDGMVIDHQCWNPACVNIDHLRIASNAENTRSLKGPSAGKKIKVRNVYQNGSGFMVRIMKDGKGNYFGTYPTIEQAAKVANDKRAELFGKFQGARYSVSTRARSTESVV